MFRMTKGSARSRRLSGWLAAVLCVLLGGAVGLWVHSQLPRTYAARTSVLVLPTVAGLESSISGSRSTGAVEIDTEVELARSAQVSQQAADALDGRMTPTQLLRATTVTVPTNSTVLVMRVQASDAVLARDAATAVAQAYLDRRKEGAETEIAAVVSSLSSQVDDLTGRLQVIANTLATLSPTDTGGRALAESQRSVLVSQLADVNSRLVALQSGSSTGGEVITVAQVPSSPQSPRLWVDLGAGLLGGALIGGLLLMVLERRGSMRTAALRRGAVSRDLGVLDLDSAEVAAAKGRAGTHELAQLVSRIDGYRGGREGPEVVVAVAPPSVVERLVLSLNATWVQDRGNNVLVVAQHGVLESLTGTDTDGLAEVVRDEVTAQDAVRDSATRSGRLLGPGRGSPQLPPAALRTSLAELWASLRRPTQGVLVVLVPPLDSVEAQSVLRTAGRVVVVVHPETSDDEEVAGLYEDLGFLGLSERLVGTVELNTKNTRPAQVGQPASAVRKKFPAQSGAA